MPGIWGSGDQRGYTALELMMIIIIMGVLMSMAMPAFTKLAASHRANSAADQLADLVRLLRAKAIDDGEQFVLTWNTGAETYAAYTDVDQDESVGDDDTLVRATAMPQGVDLEMDDDNPFPSSQVIFYGSGKTSASGTWELTDTRGKAWKVNLYMSTGVVEVVN